MPSVHSSHCGLCTVCAAAGELLYEGSTERVLNASELCERTAHTAHPLVLPLHATAHSLLTDGAALCVCVFVCLSH